MGQGRPKSLATLLLLLFAVVVQGITPDAHDLASLNALRILCPEIVDPLSATDDDESPDDVCSASHVESSLAARLRKDGRTLPWLVDHLVRPVTPVVSANGRLSLVFSAKITHVDDVIHLLCRLNC